MQGVFLDRGSVDAGDLDLAALTGSLSSWRFHDETRPEELAGRLADAEAAVSNKVVLDRAHLEGAARLRLICVAATGTNNVDLAAARERGITVCNVRGYATPSVVQHVYSLILALTTRALDYHALVAQGRWQDSPHFCRLDFPIRELSGKVLGVVGYGELGRAVAEVAPAFGMQVRVAQRPGTAGQQEGRVGLPDLLPQVDVLTLHCPLADNTRNLIGAAQLAAMRDDALLINAARGGIVDEQALADALRAGRLGGAGVDVLTEEPPRRGNPLLAPDIPNLIVTPHIAWASRESRQRLVDQLAENIRAFRAGKPRNAVNA